MKKKFLLACFLFAILAYSPSASAITFDLNTTFGPAGAEPSIQPPLLTAAFEDVSGGVQLTLLAANLPTDNTYVSKWYFNIFKNSFVPPPKQIGQETDPRRSAYSWSPDKIDAGTIDPKDVLGDGFDILLSFPAENSTGNITITDVFGPKDSATFLFSAAGTAGIKADWFNELNTAGAFYAAANIIKFGEVGENWIASGPVTPPKPVPEPGTMLLFGFGLIGVAFSGGRNLLK